MAIRHHIQKKQTVYAHAEVMKKTLAYFGGDELAAGTWVNKYALRNKEGEFVEQSPEEMHLRMSREFERIENRYRQESRLNGSFKKLSLYGQSREHLDGEKIYQLFRDFRYVIPQGSVMYALGNPFIYASLSNCVVLPEIYDSYGGIMYTDQQLAQLFKRRCGVGIDLSTLRPSGMAVSNAAFTTSGAVSFMDRFSHTTREVAQNGRRGALMMTMDVAHPDIKDFVSAKQDLGRVTGANISVRLSDEFMDAVEKDKDFMLRWPVDSPDPAVTRPVKARELWDTIIKCAHETAEPGLIFWDRQHDYSTSSVYPGFRNVSTNPCSEIAMQGGDSCRLMALNLYSFVDQPFTKKAVFNHGKFYEVTYEAQRLMDDLVDLELEAIERILDKVGSDSEPDFIKAPEINTWKLLYESGRKGRRTGLGFTALADTIAALGLKFDSGEALKTMEQIMQTKCRAEFDSSIDMALERGKFEAFDPEIEKTSGFVKMMEKELPDVYERMLKHGRRNISISTVAPTGSLSILARCSSGIEPVFMMSYTRRKKINPADSTARADFVDQSGDSWQEFDVHHPRLKTWMEVTGSRDIGKSPYAGSTAAEIDWIRRVEIQACIQKYVTHSISSTINLPSGVSPGMVAVIYMEAWKKGLKGITVYRDGSRSGVLLTGKEAGNETAFAETVAPKRPESLDTEIVRFFNEQEKWIAFVGLLGGRPYEIFTGKAEDSFTIPDYVMRGWTIKTRSPGGKKRYDFQYLDKDGYRVTIEGLSRSFNQEYWNYAKLISGILRHGMPLPQVVDLVSNLNLYNETINTWKNGVGRALRKFIPDGTPAHDHECPQCGDPGGLIYEEGCLKCRSCDMSGCG
jgi:ribonucleoside-diphosphate reductase alpha chain